MTKNIPTDPVGEGSILKIKGMVPYCNKKCDTPPIWHGDPT
jgi:hypothetical protein